MLTSKITLVNQEKIEGILKELVQNAYEEVNEEQMLLCLECGDVDLTIATMNHDEFQDAIKENFELDEFGEIITHDKYLELMEDLHEYYVEIFHTSGLFDYFPSGFYEVNGKKVFSETDMLAPMGIFYAPFDEAKKESSD
ncbi:hypothetical protein ELQ35_05365 [Peribacillus cavernae]|uniref:Uncharacterized protein n=1 Tax=Peribacillus cavernae TaxID=1674310 RepID=A0A3S0VR57_9BACI|nr:hypothetical protein [Peribacillus cavernae]MDQ0218810.1 hypothetical protein [Peribacillus cavernae]RUQ31018.1 hypothetical protein ELQ35_05365 [Peribacillus cavernae]